jgi:hypothetical protein
MKPHDAAAGAALQPQRLSARERGDDPAGDALMGGSDGMGGFGGWGDLAPCASSSWAAGLASEERRMGGDRDRDREVDGDGARFAQEIGRPEPPCADALVDTAADLVGGWMDQALTAGPGDVQDLVALEFSVESLSLGALRGRVSVSAGRAEVELQAFRPATAAALRSRQSQLQQMVRRGSDGDVELRIL